MTNPSSSRLEQTAHIATVAGVISAILLGVWSNRTASQAVGQVERQIAGADEERRTTLRPWIGVGKGTTLRGGNGLYVFRFEITNTGAIPALDVKAVSGLQSVPAPPGSESAIDLQQRFQQFLASLDAKKSERYGALFPAGTMSGRTPPLPESSLQAVLEGRGRVYAMVLVEYTDIRGPAKSRYSTVMMAEAGTWAGDSKQEIIWRPVFAEAQ